MSYSILAGAIVTLHLAFILFVVFGGILALRNAAWAWAHVPAVIWVAYIEFSGTICPLTPLENVLRTRAGQAGYSGGFIEHYLLPIVYPIGLTPSIQVVLGFAMVILNVIVYGFIWRRRRRMTEPTAP